MDENIIQFVPRANPNRRIAQMIEIKNVAIVPDDPSEYAMDDDTAPAEYVAPDQDSA